jgi:hypothetical protein
MSENDAEIFKRLGKIEQTCARIDERTERQDMVHADHEKRIRDLELEGAKRKGVLAAVSSLGGLIGAGVMWLIKTAFGSAQ